MAVALKAPLQERVSKSPPSRTVRLMMGGLLLYALAILAGHVAGFPLSYAYLQRVCSRGCALTPGNLAALNAAHIPLQFYANLYETIQVIYVLVCVGIALLIAFKKPGQWVPLGMSAFLLGLSAYEGANYPALVAAHPALAMPAQFLISGVGMGILGTYALLTFPNGRFGTPWILGYYLLGIAEGLVVFFFPNPATTAIDNIFSTTSFLIIPAFLVYRCLRLLSPKERNATKWIIFSLCLFNLVTLIYYIVEPITPGNSLIFVVFNLLGFFGCGINIAGFLMAVMYANAFDIDVFVRRTLVYLSLTAILLLLYTGLVLGSQYGLALFNVKVSQSPPLLLVGSTLIVAALFQPLRRRLQYTIDRRFYRQKYNAARVIERFGSDLRNETNLAQLGEQLVGVVQETMQPDHVSLWLCQPIHKEKQADLMS